MKKIFFIFLVVIITVNISYSQFRSDLNNNSPLNNPFNAPAAKIGLGIHTGFAYMKNSVGFDMGVLAEIKLGGIAVTPEVNYWNNDEFTNFEMAGLIRFYFEMPSLSPYIDGGLGVNFLTQRTDLKTSYTDLGLDLGGGLEFLNIGKNFNLFLDAKYKIIINDDVHNISGFTVTGGIKFLL